MKLQIPQSVKTYILQFANVYHRYKVETENLCSVRYRIHSTLVDYQKTQKIQLAITDKPGDFLPIMTIGDIKKLPDILSGLHPIDVNSINDLYYLSQDKVSEVIIQGDTIQAVTRDGQIVVYDINAPFDHEHSASKRIAFLIGHMQAEKMMRNAYSQQDKYKVVQDNITTLQIFDSEANEHVLMNPLDILFSEQYRYFSKEDIARIGYICGQMSRVQSKDTIA